MKSLWPALMGLMLCVGCSTPVLRKSSSCNLYWAMRQVHVCLVGMPESECRDLFLNPGFTRDRSCVCDNRSYKRAEVEIPGYKYKQVSCRL
ncbi:MAG: hypothetical protein HS115_16800 [Spirochaetales bacterium]|nr:hypothetical protein [Spirochaetales bacterium]